MCRDGIVARLILIVLLQAIAFSTVARNDLQGDYNSRCVFKRDVFYSLEIASFNINERFVADSISRSLKDNCHLSYLYVLDPRSVDPPSVSVRVGLYESHEGANQASKLLQSAGKYCRVVRQEFVVVKQDSLTVIVTPLAVWLETPRSRKELYNIDDLLPRWSLLRSNIYPSISPRADEVVFEFRGQVHVINVATLGRKTFEHRMSNSFPQISPSGKYIAYITDNEWEEKSCLWVIRKDSTFTPLINVDLLQGQYAVKHFCWHPELDLVFLVMGYPYGTVTVGGSIYASDMSGKIRLLIRNDFESKQEILSNLTIDRDSLYFTIAQFDTGWNGIIKRIERHAPLDSLIKIYYDKHGEWLK